MERRTPSKFIVIVMHKVVKVQSLKEAELRRSKLEAEMEENYPWESRHAHIYSLLR